MPTLSDLSIDPFQSPRLLKVAEAAGDLSVQDMHDTVQDIVEEPAFGTHPAFISTDGKQDLGGGVLVGLSSTLRNVQVVFFADRTPLETGTVTTPDTGGLVLTDSAATFVTSLVTPGTWVVNWRDRSIGTVLKVDSETQCTLLRRLGGGGANLQFDAADAYTLFPVTKKELSGGNVVAVDAVGSGINAVLPTCLTQVVATRASSATTQEQADIRFGSYVGGVTIDVGNVTGNATSGTAFPVGTLRSPVNNVADMLLIQAAVGLPKAAFVIGNLTLSAGTLDGFAFFGENQTKTTITVSAAASTVDCEFAECTLTGALDGGSNLFRSAALRDVSGLDGQVTECSITGNLAFAAGGVVAFARCNAYDPIHGLPVLDFTAGGEITVTMTQWSAGLQVENMADADDSLVVGFTAGRLKLEPSCTLGRIFYHGFAYPVDDRSAGSTVMSFSSSTAVVNQSVLVAPADSLGANGRKVADLMGITGKVVEHADAVIGTPGHIRVPVDGSEQDIAVKQVDGSTVRLNEL